MPVAAPSGSSSSSSTPPLPGSSSGNLPWWRRLLDETKEVGKATSAQITRLAKYWSALWRGRSLRRDATSAQRALGQRMVETGHGDPQLRSQIAALDEKIRQAEAAKQSTRAFQAERDALLLRLAEPAMAQKVVTPADAEHRKALDAQAALQRHAQASTTARATLPPSDKTGWRRMLIGVGTMSGFCILGFCLMCGGMATLLGPGGTTGDSGLTGKQGNTSTATLTARQLLLAYTANEKEADKKYNGSILELVGVVQDHDELGGIHLEGGTDIRLTITCGFDEKTHFGRRLC